MIKWMWWDQQIRKQCFFFLLIFFLWKMCGVAVYGKKKSVYGLEKWTDIWTNKINDKKKMIIIKWNYLEKSIACVTIEFVANLLTIQLPWRKSNIDNSILEIKYHSYGHSQLAPSTCLDWAFVQILFAFVFCALIAPVHRSHTYQL